MSPKTSTQAFADATAALVDGRDVVDILARLLHDCADLLGADAMGLLVQGEGGDLELLSSTSHRVAELELFQIQRSTGPCVDAIASGEVVLATSAQQIVEQWDEVGRSITAAGFATVCAFPLRWHGHPLGGLNVFSHAARAFDSTHRLVGQAFADVATAVIVQSGDYSTEQLTPRINRVIAARTIVEQAKGVLAHQHGVDMGDAYDLLIRRSREDGVTLTDAARRSVEAAYRRR